jgi:hypothetical protein
MVKKDSKRFVIDASVAKTAGYTSSNHSSSQCRKCLLAIQSLGFVLFMTDEIKAEWDKHASSFSIKWRREMIAKKQWKYLSISPDSSRRNKIETIILSCYPHLVEEAIFNLKKEIFKDYCLIEAALASDKTVISLDDKTARKLFSQASQNIDEIKEIVWVNPAKNEEKPIEWLMNGAPPETQRFLVNYLQKNTQ